MLHYKSIEGTQSGRNIAQHNKGYMWQHYIKWRRYKALTLKSGRSQGCPLCLFVLCVVLKVLAIVIRQDKQIKRIWIGKEEVNALIQINTDQMYSDL